MMMGSAYHGETYEAVLSPRPVQQSKRRSVKYSYHKERTYNNNNTRVPLRNSDNVLIRLNVIADEIADIVLENGFWPDYVTCSPWRPKHQTRDQPPRMRGQEPGRPIGRGLGYRSATPTNY